MSCFAIMHIEEVVVVSAG